MERLHSFGIQRYYFYKDGDAKSQIICSIGAGP